MSKTDVGFDEDQQFICCLKPFIFSLFNNHRFVLGFYGETCNTCIALPGCQHGYCNNSFECKCLEGWDGIFCSERNDDFLLKVIKAGGDGVLKLFK